jgi:hypothetical protein
MENFPDTQNKEPEKKDKNINEINDKSEIVLNNININGVIKEKKLKANHEREKYISLANFYINLNIKPNDYNNVTPESMNNYLSIITEEKIMKWEIKLYNNFNYYKTITEQKILKVKKDNPYQPVIVNDAKRTRVRESTLIPNYKEILENLLTFYCISKDIYYKQGLNEIYGPLLLMKYKLKNLKLSKIFLFGEVFIDKFLPNYYYESDFCALKSSLRLFFILLKYHEPSVYNILDKNEILPEMYATNWLITLMSGKMRLDILFLLWDYLLEIDDTLFIHYIFVSLLVLKREIIINCDKSLLPQLISNLTILEIEELKEIVETAKELRKKTPYSFRILANKLGILIPNCKNLKERYEKYKPEMIQAIPIFPQEIFYMSSKNNIICPNPDCINGKNYTKIYLKNGKTKYNLDFDFINKKEEDNNCQCLCEKCDMNIEKELDYTLIDLRMTENKEDKMERDGFWQKIIELNQDELKSEEINEILAEKYIDLRGKCHFIFLTSTTDTFSKFESDFYKNNISEQDKLKMIYGLMEQKKIDKELDLNAGNLSKKEIYKLKEYDNLRKTLKSMQNQNYPYISFVYGGYYKMHEESVNMDLELPTHDIETCEICNENKNIFENKSEKEKKKDIEIEKEKKKLYKLLWEHKKRIKYKNLEQYFKDSNISIIFGSLNEYKGKNLIYEKIQILIAILFSKYKIEIYKFDIKKQHNSNKTNYYDLGLDFEQQKDIDLIILEELKITDILGMSIDKKVKNIINMNIKEKHSGKGNKKEEIIKYHSYNMVIDLSSSNDAKNFFKSFRKMSNDFKEHINKNK